jgi:integrase/recombinase XerD
MKSNEVPQLITGFEHYLKDGIMQLDHSVRKYKRRVEHFIQWVQSTSIDQVRYTEIMEYVRYCQQEEMSTKTINNYLRSVRHFYDYLNKEQIVFMGGSISYNPAKGVQIKGAYQTIRPDYLKEDVLDSLYEQYNGKHKILLGLLVYQGLKLGEIERLEKIHFDLKKGTVYIPKTINGNSRKLKLAPDQLYDLMEHLLKRNEDSLLGYPLQNNAIRLCKELREVNSSVKNSSHLRGSRISYWVRNYNIREAQYLAGHTTIAGTEKYRSVNIEDLQEELRKFHPMS